MHSLPGPATPIASSTPTPTGHPDEIFVVEYRATVTAGGTTFDRVEDPGMYVYHINAKNPSTDAPWVELLADPSKCPAKLVPFQTALSPSSSPALQFHDGTSAKFRLLTPTADGDQLKVTVQFI